MTKPLAPPADDFVRRHVGPDDDELRHMLDTLGVDSLEALLDETLPQSIRDDTLDLPAARSEPDVLGALRRLAAENRPRRSLIGMGYYPTVTPGVIQRNVLENPAWYTAYTPYQPEISQGRLEALLNFQTTITELTGLEVANSSLLDEATAAAEAMSMTRRVASSTSSRFFVHHDTHPQTIAVLATRARPIGVELVVGDVDDLDGGCFGALFSYPTSTGAIVDWREHFDVVHEHGGLVVVATDLLACTLLTPPGELGADIAVGSAQRFGVPMGFGGPHAAFISAHATAARAMPGRIVGVSTDTAGRPALRLALQTREQHIRRERATSNICTAQVLLANIAGLYACWHGPEGLQSIASRIHNAAASLAATLAAAGLAVRHDTCFDTVTVDGVDADAVLAAAGGAGHRPAPGRPDRRRCQRRRDDHADVIGDVVASFGVTAGSQPARRWVPPPRPDENGRVDDAVGVPPPPYRARDAPLPAPPRRPRPGAGSHDDPSRVVHDEAQRHHRDGVDHLAGVRRSPPVRACRDFRRHAALDRRPRSPGWRRSPATPRSASSPTPGARASSPGCWRSRPITGHAATTGVRVCMIPSSAHGTNAASAVMAGMDVVVIATDADGNVDVDDLAVKLEQHGDRLGAMMLTYPSTHGVFEERIGEICDLVHAAGGQVYVDGANLNALVGLARPGTFGADVSHLNLHKTFCIPHGGGGPGVGPIGVREHLVPFLPGDPLGGGDQVVGPVSAAPFGSAGILGIPWAYIALMGPAGLRHATTVAICSANYLAVRLGEHYPVLYTGAKGRVGHECIIDLRGITKSTGVTVDDVAKRLIDFGIHAPTMSFPVAGTLMIEPTESETLAELERFVQAMITIRGEIDQVADGTWPLEREPAPARATHRRGADRRVDAAVSHASSAPTRWRRCGRRSTFPPVSRIDGAAGDRNLVCSCEPLESYAEALQPH